MKNKLIYGFKRLHDDLLGKEDYWHPRLISRNCDFEFYKYKYYLDFSPKGIYPFYLQEGLPIVEMNGKGRLFSITIFNYGIGLIDLHSKNYSLIPNIQAVLDWALINQESDGSWRNNYRVPFFNLESGWTSAMSQGLGISFLFRCYNLNLISKVEAITRMENAKNFMMNSELNSPTEYGNVLQEFGGTKENVLNGFIFSIYGIRDYCQLINDFSLFDSYIDTLTKILFKYKIIAGWSYYTTTKIISSTFYHQLHIDMMNSLFHLTKKEIFKKQADNWRKGYKFRLVFTLLKAIQKLIKFNSINTLNTQ